MQMHKSMGKVFKATPSGQTAAKCHGATQLNELQLKYLEACVFG